MKGHKERAGRAELLQGGLVTGLQTAAASWAGLGAGAATAALVSNGVKRYRLGNSMRAKLGTSALHMRGGFSDVVDGEGDARARQSLQRSIEHGLEILGSSNFD
ncbi:hypothetical protein M0R45_026455 [Rubus argutus]|uniref:Uncharacterized protein n=1 Tax=Rubus argutus TaxID=59490 RepID=A0AAW1X061_RUBAR